MKKIGRMTGKERVEAMFEYTEILVNFPIPYIGYYTFAEWVTAYCRGSGARLVQIHFIPKGAEFLCSGSYSTDQNNTRAYCLFERESK
jgi:hypothetical protein